MLVTDEAGQQVWSAEYTPFGKQVSKEGELDRAAKFTGKDLDEDTGLYYYNARWMDSETGRFISQDPAEDPNSPNYYSYCANNPLKRLDPTGLWSYEVDEKTGQWYAVAEQYDDGRDPDTLWSLSEQAYGTGKYASNLQADNIIDDPTQLKPGDRILLGDYNEQGHEMHGQLLKAGYLFGGVSYSALLKQGFDPSANLLNNDERSHIVNYYRLITKLYEAGTITEDQYYKETVRLDSSDGVLPTKGYLYDLAYGTLKNTYPELYLLGGFMAYRAAAAFGSAIFSSPLIQKMITNDKAITAQTTVLGKWKEIEQLKGTYNMLNINTTVFKVLEFTGKGWEVNRMWLDRCIARGDKFYLGSNALQYLRGDSYFSQELQYMISQGYRIAGNFLIKSKF